MKSKLIKTCLTVAILTVMAPILQATPSAIEVFTEEYHVWGNLRVYPDGPSGNYIEDSYDTSDSTPISGYVEWIGSNQSYSTNWAHSSTELLGVSANSYAFWVHPESQSIGYAEGSWTFQPEWDLLRLNIEMHQLYYISPITVELVDVTSSTTLFSYNGNVCTFPDYDWYCSNEESFVQDFLVDPTHEYSMYAKIMSGANDDGPWYGSISSTVIPEPTTLILIGLGAVVLIRKH